MVEPLQWVKDEITLTDISQIDKDEGYMCEIGDEP